jgi:hypothetical protein
MAAPHPLNSGGTLSLVGRGPHAPCGPPAPPRLCQSRAGRPRLARADRPERLPELAARALFRSRDERTLARGAPLLKALHHAEHRRHEENGKAGRRQHAAEHRDADRLARAGAGATRDHERKNAEDEGERRHENRPEARLRRLDRRVEDGSAVDETPLTGHLDDEDGVFGRQRDQQDSADLRVEIVVDAQN